MKPMRWIFWLGLILPISAVPSLRNGCEAGDQEFMLVQPEDTVQVISALAGSEKTCYKVTLMRDGKKTVGYVLGEALPAVAAFAHAREKAAAASFEEEAQWRRLSSTSPKPAPEKSPSTAGLPPNMPRTFEDFSARDSAGNKTSLSGMGGRVILVTFWSPGSPASIRQLVSLAPLFNQYKNSGLKAVGISADPNPSRVLEALDDVTLGWPQVPDRSGLAARYGVNAKAGTTLVLDADHHIVAAGLSGPELEQKVRELLAER
jgi:peroxiredoxin